MTDLMTLDQEILLACLLLALALVMVPAFVVPAWRAWRTARQRRQWQAWARSAPAPLEEVTAELEAQRLAAAELWSQVMPGLRTPALPAPRAAAVHAAGAATEGAEIIAFRPRPVAEPIEAGAGDD